MLRDFGGVNLVQKIRNTLTLGFVQAVRVLCDVGSSLFYYSASSLEALNNF